MRTAALGPGGLPYAARKAGPPACRQVLYENPLGWMSNGELPGDFNFAFIALLPKVASADLAPYEARPLSLANADSNIIAMMLRLSLEPRVHAVLSPIQAGSLGG